MKTTMSTIAINIDGAFLLKAPQPKPLTLRALSTLRRWKNVEVLVNIPVSEFAHLTNIIDIKNGSVEFTVLTSGYETEEDRYEELTLKGRITLYNSDTHIVSDLSEEDSNDLFEILDATLDIVNFAE